MTLLDRIAHRRRTVAVVAAVAALGIGLAGCQRTIQERVADRDACQAAGGTYQEWLSGFNTTMSSCDLSETPKE